MTDEARRKVWRRSTGAVPAQQFAEDVLCGDGEPTSREYFLQMREKRLAYMAENKRIEEEKAAEDAKLKARKDDEDPDKAAERYRNDRYAVKLLRQQENVWGSGGPDLGALG
ncbi:hypothetical protein [Actinoplanes derwentensis]|uniref:Uncharacterized protein n=1 Tax=Actinoplanes derwentensis TaxID=113562 RepID=A0A1H1XLI7_9ACTN|nr:hypothetical protein [Actinoplanes derwentensis]GID87743.1 hypothetical protein Ade03nite_66670 [Actinoplanes derwentensis]SDT10090.1 hypothetical protein SAMN04489716_2507 [Actinoplanes derwentensis]